VTPGATPTPPGEHAGPGAGTQTRPAPGEGPRPGTVTAAGAVVWRTGPAGLEVLLVHSPRHDEWSWPKGKLHDGETLPECAVREIAEETGLTAVLGRPLPPVEYLLPDGRPKRVAYWAAEPVSASDHPTDPEEIDGTAWVGAEQARRMLPHPGQGAPLDALDDLARQGYADTRPMVVVRHADALHRREWSGADRDRPITAQGWREAAALARLLACWRPTRLVSSTSRRCVDTVAGYAEATGLVLHTDPVLSEEGFTAHPDGIRGWVATLIEGPEPSLVCTHRPVLAVLMHELAGHLAGTPTGAVPDRDPFLRPGEVLAAHITGAGADPKVVAVERHHPVVTT